MGGAGSKCGAKPGRERARLGWGAFGKSTSAPAALWAMHACSIVASDHRDVCVRCASRWARYRLRIRASAQARDWKSGGHQSARCWSGGCVDWRAL